MLVGPTEKPGFSARRVTAAVGDMFERLLQNAVDIKSENDLTV